MKRLIWILSVSFLVVGLIAIGGVVFIKKPDLVQIHRDIEADYHGVHHMDAEAFSTLAPQEVVIFDVREEDEFAVSHLSGAVRVAPDIDPLTFQAQYADLLAGKTAVFYCSVGRRSSHLAEKVSNIVMLETGHEPINLIGGIFHWSNEKRPLVAETGVQTTAVHPYNQYWGQLLKDPNNIHYTPIVQKNELE